MTQLSTKLWQQIKQQAETKKNYATVKNKSITYKQLKKSIESLSGFFNSLKKHPERVMVLSKNDIVVSEIILTCLVNGITFTVLDCNAKYRRNNLLCKRFSPDVVFIDQDYSSLESNCKTIQIATDTKSINLKALFGIQQPQCPYLDLLKKSPTTEPNTCKSTLNDKAYVMFTSGTTASPKGVVISNNALDSHLTTLINVFQHNGNSRILNSLNLSHADGLVQGPILNAYLGSYWHSQGPFSINDIKDTFDCIAREKITNLITVPTTLALIYRVVLSDDAMEKEFFKGVISTGGYLNKELWINFEKRFSTNVYNIYGLTETTVGGVFSGPTLPTFRYDAVGIPVDCEVKIVDQKMEPLADGESGLLLMKGSLLMSEYYLDSQATNTTLKDGWLNTGDIAVINNGFVSILGRNKSVFNIGGYSIHPEEINEVIQLNQNVSNAYTTVRKDDVFGDYIVSLVQIEIDNPQQVLAKLCREYLEDHKVPKIFLITNNILLGRSGKVEIEDAENQIDKLLSTNVSKGDDIVSIAANVFGLSKEELTLDSNVYDTLGWDSLGHLMLITEFEQTFNIKLTTQQIMKIESLADLERLI